MATVPGSLFRRILFWSHLSAGVAAGLVIFVLSATGVLLAYEHQLVERAHRANRITDAAGQAPLGADALADAVRREKPGAARFNLVFDADPAMPVTATQGREFSLLLHPFTGAVMPDASQGMREFLRAVEGWHRWLAGEVNGARAAVVDLANLLFLVMIVTGLYLWMPGVWRWRTLRGLLLFRGKYVNAKVRDFAWHHVFGVWALVPLFVIALSGVVMSYPWANALLYKAYGEQAPQRRGPPGPPGGAGGREPGARPGVAGGAIAVPPAGSAASLDALLAAARSEVSGWTTLTLPAGIRSGTVDVSFELEGGGPRPSRQTVTLDAADARVLKTSVPAVGGAAASTPAQRARTWMRFAHTGEQYGVLGQTLAMLASAAACFLVYTGLALAWRRLILPLLRPAG